MKRKQTATIKALLKLECRDKPLKTYWTKKEAIKAGKILSLVKTTSMSKESGHTQLESVFFLMYPPPSQPSGIHNYSLGSF